MTRIVYFGSIFAFLFALSVAQSAFAERVQSEDIALEAAVERALIADARVPDHLIEVSPFPWQDGWVKLVGSVEHEADRRRAERVTLAVPGVEAVVNELTLKDIASIPDVSTPPSTQ